MPKTLSLTIEVSGCPTTCMHCWANGGAYPSMPLADIEWVLEQSRGFCENYGLKFVSYPLHEMLAHFSAAQILPLFAALHNDAFEPIATTGIPLAMREDWQELLTAIKNVGTTTLWFTFHGIGSVHDRAVNRKGAYEETCLALSRAKMAGLRCGCNVFVTKENLKQFRMMVQKLQELGLDEMGWEVARYHPTLRRRLGENSRPELACFSPYADEIADLSVFWKDKWRNIADYTEGAYVLRAINGEESERLPWQFPVSEERIPVVCRSNLDVYSGAAGNYESYHGNLRQDGVEQVLEKALKRGPVSDDDIYFTAITLPAVHQLAEEVGVKDGTKVYFSAAEMRLRWLDIALADYRRY